MTAASSHGPFWLQRPTPEELRSLLWAQREQPLSYREVGATRGGTPPGYHAVRRTAVLGRDPETFARASAGLRAWAPHRAAGVELLPPTPEIAEGANLLGAFRAFPFFVTTACRVVYVIDQESRYGFAYGTLAHHPEQGEEAFVVERDADGQVSFVITAFSRPAHALTRLGSPAGKVVQARVTHRYLSGLRDWVSSG